MPPNKPVHAPGHYAVPKAHVPRPARATKTWVGHINNNTSFGNGQGSCKVSDGQVVEKFRLGIPAANYENEIINFCSRRDNTHLSTILLSHLSR